MKSILKIVSPSSKTIKYVVKSSPIQLINEIASLLKGKFGCIIGNIKGRDGQYIVTRHTLKYAHSISVHSVNITHEVDKK